MDKKVLWVGAVSFLLIAIAVLINMVFAKPASFRGTAYSEPYPAAPKIDLQQANGKSFHLSDQQGRIVLIFFGYTSCPDVCPTTLAELNLALGKLGDKSKNIQVLFVSVDPQRDTPEKIQNYVERFNPSFIGLSGSLEELQQIWQGYGVFREIAQGGNSSNYIVNHTARIILVDSRGNLRLSYGFQTPPEDITSDIDILLSQ
jgi:protein SCO1/2